MLDGGASIGGKGDGAAHNCDVLARATRCRQLDRTILSIYFLNKGGHAFEILGTTTRRAGEPKAAAGFTNVPQLKRSLRAQGVLLQRELYALGLQPPKAGIDAFHTLPSIPSGQLAEVLIEPHQLSLLHGSGSRWRLECQPHTCDQRADVEACTPGSTT